MENRFPITAAGLTELSRRLVLHTKRFVTAAIAVPAAIVLLSALLILLQRSVSPYLIGALAIFFLFFFLSTLRKTPERMAAQIYAEMRRDGAEPVQHTRLTQEGAELLNGEGETVRLYKFAEIRLIFDTENYLAAVDRDGRAVYWKKDAYLSGDEASLLRTLREKCPAAAFRLRRI